MATGLQQRRCTGERPARIHEVHRVGTPALGIPVEPRRLGGLGVLDPRLLLHNIEASTPVLAREGSIGNMGVLTASPKRKLIAARRKQLGQITLVARPGIPSLSPLHRSGHEAKAKPGNHKNDWGNDR
jgi:hypothetical protein